MTCKLKHKSSEKNAKQYLVQYGVLTDINSTDILSGELFNQAVGKVAETSTRAYSVTGIPFTNNNGVLETNKNYFKQIDDIRKGLGLYESQEPHVMNQEGAVLSAPSAPQAISDERRAAIEELFNTNPELANQVYSKILTNSGISGENLLSLLLKDNIIEKQCS